MAHITVDFDKKIGAIKPMHAVNNGPMTGGDNPMFHYLKDAGIPYARLHDTGGRFGGFCYVDIENVFRDFDRDASDPASYDFAFTDHLLAGLMANGAKPFYRLGATIENDQRIKAYHIYPPKDAAKWARICEGIVRHYNEGWGNGFHYNIEYWEIWNEPDNEPVIADNPMWKGTDEEFFHLYEVTANHLKKCFPHLKIGGYASCGFYAILERASDANAHVSPRTEYFVEFFEKFMRRISDPAHKAPLDFFSWHSYGSRQDNVAYAKYARETLDRFGFTHTESILNEWNPGPALRGKLRDASNIAAMMCEMQNSSVDLLMYYDGQVSSDYCGLFDPISFGVFKAYYAFVAFNRLYQNGVQVAASSSDPDLLAVASANALLLVNDSDEPKPLALNFTPSESLLVDQTHDFTPAPSDMLPARGIMLLGR